MADDEDYHVPGRECGSCTACCTHLAIISDGMQKLPGIDCEHCLAGAGCAIYDARPSVCRGYHCGWRNLPYLDESWRPDRSGVLINLQISQTDSEQTATADMILIGDLQVLDGDRFAGMAAGFIESGTETWLVLPAEPGMMAYNVMLNTPLAPAIAARDLAQVKAILRESAEMMRVQPPVPLGPEQMGAGYLGPPAPRIS